MSLFRRLFPRVQTAQCSGCWRTLHEYERKPCPTCGSLARIVSAGMEMAAEPRHWWQRPSGLRASDKVKQRKRPDKSSVSR